jgi:hypothetical protein
MKKLVLLLFLISNCIFSNEVIETLIENGFHRVTLNDKSTSMIEIYYGFKEEGLNYSRYPFSLKVNALEINHSITLTDLLPETNYYCVIRNGENLSQQYVFRTPKSNPSIGAAPCSTSQSAADFTIIALPDSQNYTYSSTNYQLFIDQAQWIINQRINLNIVLVDHLGDIVDYSEQIQWTRARPALDLLSQNNIAIGVSTGNHDYNAINANTGPADLFDKNFPATTAIALSNGLGIASYQQYGWYGGYMGATNDVVTADDNNYTNRQWKNNYVLFSAGGMDFINIALEYNFPFETRQWLNDVLNAFPNRRAIISTHHFLNDNNTVSSLGSIQGVLSDVLAQHCNVFMILCGHNHDGDTPGESAVDLINSCGKPLYIRMSDYQDEANGGNGYLRMMTFKPSANSIEIKTYSPILNTYKTDADSQFTLFYDMSQAGGINMTITAPANNAIFPSGTINIPISVSTDATVDYVEFKLNGVTFTDNNNADTTFQVTTTGVANWLPNGTYTIDVIAHDVQTNTSLTKQVTIIVGAISSSFEVRITAKSNDAEENKFNNGSIDLNSSDLELYTEEGVDPQAIGMRFENITIPQGATITAAYLEFTVDESTTGTVTMNLAGEAIDNSLIFTTVPYNISSRTKTNASVAWTPTDWTVLNSLKQTPDLKNCVQEIVNRSGWSTGNAMSFIVNGGNTPTATRIAYSFDSSSAKAPLLHINYSVNNQCVPSLWYADADHDTYGNNAVTTSACNQPVGYVANHSDCNDSNASIHPGATEICNDTVDQNCDGNINDGCSSITAQLRTENCGVNLTTVNQVLRGDLLSQPLPIGTTITGYRFRVKNLGTNLIRIVDRTDALFQLTYTDFAQYNTSYTIDVSLQFNQVWSNVYGAACTVTTPVVPSTVLAPSSCGVTLTQMNSTIRATAVTSATSYEFEVSLMEVGIPVQTTSLIRSSSSFNLLLLSGIAIKYGTEYRVRIKVKVPTVIGSQWSSNYGTACAIFTPMPPKPSIVGCSTQTGIAPAALSTRVYATSITGATQYRFKLTNGTNYNRTYSSTARYFKLSNFSAMQTLTPGAFYTLTVEVLVYGFYYPGINCNIKVPSSTASSIATRTIDRIESDPSFSFEVIVYPNPFADYFSFHLNSESSQPLRIAIYDMTGRLLDEVKVNPTEVNTLTMGAGFPSGIYSAIVTLEGTTKKLRLVKK